MLWVEDGNCRTGIHRAENPRAVPASYKFDHQKGCECPFVGRLISRCKRIVYNRHLKQHEGRFFRCRDIVRKWRRKVVLCNRVSNHAEVSAMSQKLVFRD